MIKIAKQISHGTSRKYSTYAIPSESVVECLAFDHPRHFALKRETGNWLLRRIEWINSFQTSLYFSRQGSFFNRFWILDHKTSCATSTEIAMTCI